MFKIKKGVIINGIKPEMVTAILAAYSFCSDVSKDCVITSALDSKHSKTSLHYVGYALDFRTRDMNKSEQEMFKISMLGTLSDEFDVVLEGNHLHCEFQPKR